MNATADLPLTLLQQRLLRAARRYGVRGVVAAITMFSLAASLVTTALGLFLLPQNVSLVAAALTIATLVPLVVAPLASTAIVRLAQVAADAHARLQVLAATDVLTGIANRRHFFDVAPAWLMSATDGALVGMLDVDRFKQINDAHGHAAGDLALVAVSRRLQHAIGPHGLVARIGGDEFALLVTADSATRRMVVDALRHACRDIEVDAELRVNASLGLDEVTPDCPIDEAMARADRALYDAKAASRRAQSATPVLRATQR